MMSAAKLVRFALVLLPVTSGLLAHESDGEQHDPVADAVRDVFFSIDTDRDGIVSRKSVASALGVTRNHIDPRRLRTVKLMDEDGDGRINPDEFEAGFRAFLDGRVQNQLECDVDGNGSLSLREYALAVPDAKGKKRENGYTDRQVKQFAALDKDKSGEATREEISASYPASALQWIPNLGTTVRMLALDENDDQKLALREFAVLYDGEPNAAEAAEKGFAQFRPKEGFLTHESISRALYVMKKIGVEAPYATRAKLYAAKRSMARWTSDLISVSDLDGDRQISIAEHASLSGLKKLEDSDVQFVRQFDLNRDGKTSESELATVLKASISRRIESTMAVDVDADGKLSKKEHALSVPNSGETGEDGRTELQRERFAAVDIDRNGKITRTELSLERTEVFIESLAVRVVMARAFAKFDTDKNGHLSKSEFQSAFSPIRRLSYDVAISSLTEQGSTETPQDGINRRALQAQLVRLDK
ncbi:MAG: hypothetical protein AAF517_10050, partial [Planctomycetota bacterium]